MVRFNDIPAELKARVIAALERTGKIVHRPATEDDITCETCADAQWWIDNGFSDAERKAFCGPSGLNCPGFDPAS